MKFQISLHVRDLPPLHLSIGQMLLLKVKLFFGNIGSVSESENMAFYSVSSVKDIVKTIIPHFLKYPPLHLSIGQMLLTQKGADFILFKQIVDLMENKAHLTIEGINKIINIKAAMNLGLSELLKSEFKDFILTPLWERPINQTEIIPPCI